MPYIQIPSVITEEIDYELNTQYMEFQESLYKDEMQPHQLMQHLKNCINNNLSDYNVSELLSIAGNAKALALYKTYPTLPEQKSLETDRDLLLNQIRNELRSLRCDLIELIAAKKV